MSARRRSWQLQVCYTKYGTECKTEAEKEADNDAGTSWLNGLGIWNPGWCQKGLGCAAQILWIYHSEHNTLQYCTVWSSPLHTQCVNRARHWRFGKLPRRHATVISNFELVRILEPRVTLRVGIQRSDALGVPGRDSQPAKYILLYWFVVIVDGSSQTRMKTTKTVQNLLRRFCIYQRLW